MCAVIAGQAAWMALGLGVDDIAGIGTIVVHPTTMTSVGSRPGPVDGLLTDEPVYLHGEAHHQRPAAAGLGRRAPRHPPLRQRPQRRRPRGHPQAGHARRPGRRHAAAARRPARALGRRCAPPSTARCATGPTTAWCATTRPPTPASSSPPWPRCSSTARSSWPRPSRRCTGCSRDYFGADPAARRRRGRMAGSGACPVDTMTTTSRRRSSGSPSLTCSVRRSS